MIALARVYSGPSAELRPKASGRYADQITFDKDRPGHDRRYAIDPRKIEREIGWRPVETFASGIRKTVQWFQGWVANVRNGGYRGQQLFGRLRDPLQSQGNHCTQFDRSWGLSAQCQLECGRVDRQSHHPAVS